MEYEEEQLRKVVKFVGISLDDSEKEQLTNTWYFYFVLDGRTFFFKRFDNKTITAKFKECKLKYENGKPVAQCIFKCEELDIEKPRSFNNTFHRRRKKVNNNFSINFSKSSIPS